MEITVQELKNLDKDSYQIIDMRDETEISHGCIPNAVHMSAEEIEKVIENQIEGAFSREKKLVICCARGRVSVDVAEALCEAGYDAM